MKHPDRFNDEILIYCRDGRGDPMYKHVDNLGSGDQFFIYPDDMTQPQVIGGVQTPGMTPVNIWSIRLYDQKQHLPTLPNPGWLIRDTDGGWWLPEELAHANGPKKNSHLLISTIDRESTVVFFPTWNLAFKTMIKEIMATADIMDGIDDAEKFIRICEAIQDGGGEYTDDESFCVKYDEAWVNDKMDYDWTIVTVPED